MTRAIMSTRTRAVVRSHTGPFVGLVLATMFCILLGLQGPGWIQYALDQGIHAAIVWRPSSPPAVDMRFRGVMDANDPKAIFSYMSFWLYNVTNVQEIRQGGKPRVAIVGPYRYRKLQRKVDVWWDSAGHVSAKDYTSIFPLADEPANPDDPGLNATIYTLNIPLVGVVEEVHGMVGPAAARLLDILVSVLAGWRDPKINGLFMQRTVGELLWGYEDALLHRLARLLPPGTIPALRVQLIQNTTSEAEAQQHNASVWDTGIKDIRNVWNVVEDHGVSEVTGWPGGPGCPPETVRGSDGLQFRPGLHCKRDVLRVWSSDLMRGADFNCSGVQYLHGVRLLRYWPAPEMTAPNPCLGQYIPGLMNISAPRAVGMSGNGSTAHGPPLFVSNPHFCYANASLREGVDGLEPCEGPREALSTWLDVEPITGATLRANARAMVSTSMTPTAQRHLDPHSNSAAGVVIPLLVSVEEVEAPKEQAEMLARSVYTVRRIKAHMGVWPLLIALCLAAAAASVIVHGSWRLQHMKLEEAAAREAEERQQLQTRISNIIQRSTSRSVSEADKSLNGNGRAYSRDVSGDGRATLNESEHGTAAAAAGAVDTSSRDLGGEMASLPGDKAVEATTGSTGGGLLSKALHLAGKTMGVSGKFGGGTSSTSNRHTGLGSTPPLEPFESHQYRPGRPDATNPTVRYASGAAAAVSSDDNNLQAPLLPPSRPAPTDDNV